MESDKIIQELFILYPCGGYSLEFPQRGSSDEYPQAFFFFGCNTENNSELSLSLPPCLGGDLQFSVAHICEIVPYLQSIYMYVQKFLTIWNDDESKCKVPVSC